MSALCLPEGYSRRIKGDTFSDVPGGLTYQPDVYGLALFLARRMNAKRVVDVGCGSGAKLVGASTEFPLVLLDSPSTLEVTLRRIPSARGIPCDLESGLPDLSEDLLEGSVVVCADVLEHLSSPERAARDLARVSESAGFVLLSTPDRDRVRGWDDLGPPANPAHSLEWSAGEFIRFLTNHGFPSRILFGHTVNTDHHRAKTTLLAISGREAVPRLPRALVRVAAVIHAYNEGDILPEVVGHLKKEGVDVHLFDNWSNDGSWEVAQKLKEAGFLSSLHRFPDQPSGSYEWTKQLEKTESFAAGLDADWVMHHDADEFRSSPWSGVSLREALSTVDELGYNAVDFTVIDFRFLKGKEDSSPPYETGLTHFEFGRRPGHFVQVKAWKNKTRVRLAPSGGHEAVFDHRRIYPLKFLMRHYPLRSQAQAVRKIHQDRFPRIQEERREKGWHTQYDRYSEGEIVGWDRQSLVPWAAKLFETEYLVERLSGVGLSE